jgi:hypothetical protein
MISCTEIASFTRETSLQEAPKLPFKRYGEVNSVDFDIALVGQDEILDGINCYPRQSLNEFHGSQTRSSRWLLPANDSGPTDFSEHKGPHHVKLAN